MRHLLEGKRVVLVDDSIVRGTTSRKSELIASNNSVEEIRRYVEADTLGYLSLRALREAVGDDKKMEYCYACYTGDYPTELVTIEQLMRSAR